LAQQGKLPVELAIKITVGVLDALSVAHNIGIIHRDVKPPNIFVTQQDVPKLLDFGIAKLVDASAESITARGVAVGTPRYMSPEQAAGDPVDARADLYAVGLVLFEMISGAGPYRASDANELFLAHLTQPAPPLSSQAARVSLELDAITASLLAKSPMERPASAKAAAQALRAALALYQKPGATPLVDPQSSSDVVHPAASPRVVDAAPTGAVNEATTRRGDVQGAIDAPTKHVGPKALEPTHDGPTIHDVNRRITIDERAGRAQRRSEPPASSAGSTVHIADAPSAGARPSDRPAPPGWWSAETRTAAEPVAAAPMATAPAAPELVGTPPPVSRVAPSESYRRWLFPAVVVVLAGAAVALTRWNTKPAEQPPVPTAALQSPTPPKLVVAPPLPAAPSTKGSAVASASATASAAPAPSALPQRSRATAAGKALVGKPATPPAALPAPDLDPAPPKTVRKAPEPVAAEPSRPALPPSGL
jgi:serine/threonine-protein kinase